MAIAWKRAMKPAPMNPSFISFAKTSGWWLVACHGKYPRQNAFTRDRPPLLWCHANPTARGRKDRNAPGRPGDGAPSGVAAGQFRSAHEQPVLGYQVASVIV